MALNNDSFLILIFILLAVCFWVFVLWRNSRQLHQQIQQVAGQHSLIRHDDRVRTLCRAVHLLQPSVTAGVDYVIRHDSPGSAPYIAEWNSSKPQPRPEELKAALEKLSDINLESEYAAMRREEYPSVGEQLDAAYQARQGNDAKQIEVDEKIRLVKEKYPKTDECL